MRIATELATEPTDEIRRLVDELEAELSAHYEAHQRHGLSLDAIFRPHIRFVLARAEGEAVGCGGVALFDGFAELKRMYVRASGRGRGVAPAILSRLEDETRAAGLRLLRLETGTMQHRALGFYQRSGFTTCCSFGDYTQMSPESVATSVFMEKSLSD